MDVLYNFFVSAGVSATAASWGVVVSFLIVLFGVVHLLCKLFSPKH